MNQLQIFNFQDANVRTVTVDDLPWFVAKDVAEILGLDTTAVARSVDDEDKALHTMQTSGGDQDMTIVNESGMYSMILKSRKKEAKTFKRWVTSEVLPAIRRTGSYSVAPREPLSEIDRLVPAIASGMGAIRQEIEAQSDRLAVVEERQKEIDPQAIESRMAYLEKCKTLLVFGTKGKPQAVTFNVYWRTLKDLIGINSFTNRAALTVPMMDRCVEYAREWCETRGVTAPSLFDHVAPLAS